MNVFKKLHQLNNKMKQRLRNYLHFNIKETTTNEDNELKNFVNISAKELKQKLFANRSKFEIWTTEVDMEKVKYYQSLPKNPYTPEELKKREAEIMKQILKNKNENNGPEVT